MPWENISNGGANVPYINIKTFDSKVLFFISHCN